MKSEFQLQLQLQAYLDGELSSSDAQAVETRLQQDTEARDLLAELRQTRSILQANELARAVPETREFYWSQISRQIQSSAYSAPRRQPRWFERLRPFFLPAGAVALLAMTLLLLWPAGRKVQAMVLESETGMNGSQTLTYRDTQEGMTVVWLAYRE